MSKQLTTIAVDLTPVLPGGENGGAKIFVLELLHLLSEIAPKTKFVLLTQSASHAELSTLDRPNMRRLMVVGPVVANTLRPRFLGLASRALPHFPSRLRRVVNRLGYKLNTALKRGGSGRLLRDMEVDLLFCPFTAPTYFELGIRTVCTIHDLQYKTYPEFFTAEDVSHRDQVFIDACRRATVIAAVSDYSRSVAIRHGDLDHERIHTIHHRIAQRISLKTKLDTNTLLRLGLASESYLVYPANFWKHKNHEMLLTAFGMACQQGLATEIKLVCTGAPGVRQDWLKNAARTMGLGERVIFPGFLPNTDLAVLIANCKGMVFPSLYEGFGLPVIEAMAAGVPVACSNTTSLPEIAGDAAILFDPRVPVQIAQAIVALAQNESIRSELIPAGLRRASEFSDTARMAKEYYEIFQCAFNYEKHKNQLAGAYVDGWTGPILNIEVAPAPNAQTLEIELLAPEWLPYPKVIAKVSYANKMNDQKFELIRGSNRVISLPVSSVGGCFEISISPTFIPAHFGFGDDQRELAVMLKRSVIVGDHGNCVELFGNNFSV